MPKNIGLLNAQKRWPLKYFAPYNEYEMNWGQFVTDEDRPKDVFGYRGKDATVAKKICRRRKNIIENISAITRENCWYMDSQQLEVILYQILN